MSTPRNILNKQTTISLITAQIPKRISKAFALDDAGNLVKAPGGPLVKGTVETRTIDNMAEFAALLETLTPAQALCFGVTGRDTATIVPQKDLRERPGAISRTRDYFEWPDGSGVLLLDYDPKNGEDALPVDELIEQITVAVPELADAPAVAFPSASSCIWSVDVELRPTRGWHLFIQLARASDIPSAGEIITKRLWLAGQGYIALSKSGQMLQRSLVDSSVWQPERLSFDGGSECGAGLEQRRGRPIIRNADHEPIQTLAALKPAEEKEYLAVLAGAKKAARPESHAAQEIWTGERLDEWDKSNPTASEDDREVMRETYALAAHRRVLMGDFELLTSTGKTVTVSQILDDPQKWDAQRFHDPLERAYTNDPRIAVAMVTSGKPYIYSHAHGGQRYTLIRQPARGCSNVKIVRPATETKPSPNVDFQCLSDAAAVVRCHIKRHINNENGGKPLAIAISPGAGKSHVLAEECDNAANRIQKIPTLTITPTRSLASEAAQKNGGDDAPARSGVKADAGFCNIYPEIRLFSAAWRSIVLHVCQSCPHGLSAMRRLGMNKDAGDDGAREEPCKYVLNTESSRMSTALSCTGKKANVDESVFKMKSGKGMRQRRSVADDYVELNEHIKIKSDQVASWIRASDYSLLKDEKMTDRQDKNDFVARRITAIRLLKKEIEKLLHFLVDNSGDKQKQLNQADFSEFYDLSRSRQLEWMDGTIAEAVHKDDEGKVEIPLRAIRDVATAIRRGTAWVRKGYLHIAVPTFLPKMIKDGGAVLDATLLPHVRMLIEAHGGAVIDVNAESATRVRQHFDGTHTKTSCDPNGKSFAREKRKFLAALKAAITEEGDPARICVISHMAFILAIMKEIVALGIPESQIGWFNRHDRGQNEWYEAGCARLVQWGVMRLSSSVIERMYMSDRQVVIEAGGNGGEVFSADRVTKVYRVPGANYEKEDEGFLNGDLDRWERSRITAQSKQAGGRLRGTRRTGSGEKLTHDIHSNFVFSSDHGFRIDEVITDAAFQTRDSLNAARSDDAGRRAAVGLAAALKDWALAGRAGKAPGRDKVNRYLRAKKLNEISSHTWNSVSKCKSVQALYNTYMTPTRILEKTGESACIADLYGESVSRMYQSAVDGILAAGGDPMNPEAIRGYFDKKVDAGEYSADLEVAEGLLMEWAITIQRTLATGTEGIS